MRDDVGATPTPLTLDQIRSVLREALDARGTTISPGAANVILAHLAFENAHGERVIQHNFGNLIATQNWAGDFWRPPWFGDPKPDWSADLRAKHQAMLEGKAPSAFRAYSSPAEGMKHYLDTLETLGLLEAAHNGPRAFAERATLRFSPDADPNGLARTLESLVERIRVGNGEPHDRTADVVALGLLGALGLAIAVDWWRKR